MKCIICVVYLYVTDNALNTNGVGKASESCIVYSVE